MTDDREPFREAVLKTPDEWCRIEGVEILDPDGWRGRNGRPWTDTITLAEFRDRLVGCTMRHVVQADERAEFKARRDAGLQKRHEQRLENATYTAAEVKVLTEAALRLGRKEAGEEIAAALERCEDDARRAERIEGIAGNKGSAKTCFDLAAGYMRSAELARQIASQPSPDATSGRTDPGVDPDLPQDSQAGRDACTCPPHIDGIGREKWPDCPVHTLREVP